MLTYDEQLNPDQILSFFEKISSIPRATGKEEAISNYVVSVVKELGLEFHQDEYFNVIVKKPGTEGYENSDPVMIQGHLDMVAEKDGNSTHNFDTDPLELIIEGDILRARETTLGADDGVAIAYGLALLSSTTIPHPPLEVIFTTEEETTMCGAEMLDGALLTSNILLNIDMSNEDMIVLGSAGGRDYTLSKDLRRKKPCTNFVPFKMEWSGLRGGHSGEDIHRGRQNAIILAATFMKEIMKKLPIELVHVRGGNFSNAIPRECAVKFYTLKEYEPKLLEMLAELKENYTNAFGDTDLIPSITLKQMATTDYPMVEEDAEELLNLILAIPFGPAKFSKEVNGVVTLSNNLGVVYTGSKKASFMGSCRGATDGLVENYYEKLCASFSSHHAIVDDVNAYPSWEYQDHSHLREVASKAFYEVYGKAPIFEIVHAGLEVGHIASKVKHLDAISIGPNTWDLHSTHERLSLSSYVNSWNFLKNILSKLG